MSFTPNHTMILTALTAFVQDLSRKTNVLCGFINTGDKRFYEQLFKDTATQYTKQSNTIELSFNGTNIDGAQTTAPSIINLIELVDDVSKLHYMNAQRLSLNFNINAKYIADNFIDSLSAIELILDKLYGSHKFKYSWYSIEHDAAYSITDTANPEITPDIQYDNNQNYIDVPFSIEFNMQYFTKLSDAIPSTDDMITQYANNTILRSTDNSDNASQLSANNIDSIDIPKSQLSGYEDK
jgi:hypothetical protein